MFLRPQFAFCLVLPLLATGICRDVTAQDGPPLDPSDGLPTGSGSPEAAACDMVRALAQRNFEMFARTRPEGGGGTDTPNSIVNHYVSFIRDTTFRADDSVVTAHELFQRTFLTPKQAASAVEIDFDLIRPYHAWAFGAHKQHSFVDVTVSDRDGNEFTTRMIVVRTRKHDLWKAYPITPALEPLYQKLAELTRPNERPTESPNAVK